MSSSANMIRSMTNRPHGNLAVPSIVCAVVILLLIIGYSYDSSFLSSGNLISLGQQTTAIGIGAIGMTFLIAAGFFDLSGSGIVPLAALVLAFFPDFHGSLVGYGLGVVAALAAGMIAGAINGYLIAFARIPAFVATLGTLYVFTSVVELITNGNNVPINNTIADAVANDVVFAYVPVGAIAFLILAAIAHFGLWHSRIGRFIRLIGVNQRSGFVWGIPVQRVMFLAFCFSGAMAAGGSIVLGGMFSSATASMALNYNLNVIAAVVIGGTRLEGGQASIIGTVIGSFTLALLTNFLTLIGVSPYLQYVVVGLLLIVAVGLGGYDLTMFKARTVRTAAGSALSAERPAVAADHETVETTSPDGTTPILAVRNLAHSYVGVPVLRDINLEVRRGECLGLLGQNGAGKSTVLNILSGKVRPVAGRILLRGKAIELSSPKVARRAGIAVVAQELELIPTLSVADNIVLGTEPKRLGLIDGAARDRIALDAIRKTGVEIDISARVEELTAGEKQLTEVARGLAAQCDLIILDEPTSSLNAQECERLMAIIEELKRHGCGIIFVSHKFAEVFRVADRLCILRDGAVVGSGSLDSLGHEDGVTQLLVGDAAKARIDENRGQLAKLAQAQTEQGGYQKRDAEPAIAARKFRAGIGNLPDFLLHYGEIVGIGGVEGSGGVELLEAFAGLREWTAEDCRVGGRQGCPPSATRAVQDGIIYLPPDRKEEGIFFDAAVAENVAVGRDIASERLFASIWWANAVSLYHDLQRRLFIKSRSEMQPCGRLSGGNQQKALFGRAIAANARIWLLTEPTRGIDVGARAEIYQLMREEAEKGKAIIVRSIDPGELSAVCRRCYVLSPSGRVTELHGKDVTDDAIYAASYDRDDLILAEADHQQAMV